MTTEIAKYKNINEQQVKLWAELYCKDASSAEIKLFLNLCDKTGMSPEARQIYMIDRWDSKLKRTVKTPMFSIEAFRLIAERSHKYSGQVGAWWCGADGVWKDVWLSEKPPAAAKVGVLRSDFKEPLYAVATYRSYCQTKQDGSPQQNWSKMPDVMLAKCAESLALRKAFSQDLSGLYTIEEMKALPESDSSTIEAEVLDAKVETNAPTDTVAKIPKKTAKDSRPENDPNAIVHKDIALFSNADQEQLDKLNKQLDIRGVPSALHLDVALALEGKPFNAKSLESVIKNMPIHG